MHDGMKKVFQLFIFILFAIPVVAQTGVKGNVSAAASKELLAGVSVIADDTNAVATEGNGDYSIRLLPGKHKLLFKMIGFAEKKIPVEIKTGESLSVNVSLEESTKELGVVVVSAGKFEQRIEDVTVSMEVIKPSLVENKNTTSMDDIVDQIPGVSVIDGQANIRGGAGWSYGAGSRVMILVDDLPQLTADAGDAKWSFLPVENLEQIEVIKGASSALFGSSALNGVINIRTAYPKETPLTKVNVFTGIYDRSSITTNGTSYKLNWWGNSPPMNSGMDFFHSRRINNFDLVIGGNIFMDEGYRRGEYEHRGRINVNTRYRSKKITGLSYGINVNTMYTDGNLFFLWKNDTTGAYIPKSATLSGYQTNRTNMDPFITYIDSKGNTHKLRTRWFGTVNINSTNQNSTADLYYAEYQFQKHVNDHFTLAAGVVQSFSKVKSELYGNHNGNNLAFFTQVDLKWNRLTFSIGARVEHFKLDSASEKYTPVFRAGVNYHALKETYIRASFGQGYRFPSIAEKFISTSVGGLYIYPNDSVKSEKGFSSEVGIMQGIKIGGWKGYFDVAAFLTEYKNMIEFTFGQWGLPSDPFIGLGFKAFNTGDTRIKGIDLSLAGTGSIGPFILTVLAGYTYMDPEQTRFDSLYVKKALTFTGPTYLGSDSSNFLKYRFNHLVKADIEIVYKKYSIGIGMRYNSFMKNIDKIFVDPYLGPQIAPGIAHYRDNHKNGDLVFDARTSIQFNRNIKLALICKNVFNYIFMQRPADMQPPRTFVVQLGFVY